jgi:transposase, IS5 family
VDGEAGQTHVSVDVGSELIRRLEITPAHVHDSQVFEELVVGDEYAVYADKPDCVLRTGRGYSGEERREYLEALGIYCGIMEKAKRRRRLDTWQEKRNKRISKVRGAVERCFGILKAHYGYVRVKYGGLKRNRCQLYPVCVPA